MAVKTGVRALFSVISVLVFQVKFIFSINFPVLVSVSVLGILILQFSLVYTLHF